MKKINIKYVSNNSLSTNIKLNEAKISKIILSRCFLEAVLNKLAGPSNKVKAVLAKTILFQLGLIAEASAADAEI